MSETNQGAMTLWRASTLAFNRIEEVPNVTGLTESSFFTRSQLGGKERRHALRSEYGNYFLTRGEAVAYLRSVLAQKIQGAQIAVQQAEAELAKFEAKYGGAE